MSTAGEAASLFGEPDTAHDPFSAALGGENPSDDPHTDAQTSNAVSDLFGSATDPFPVDGAGSSSVYQQDTQQTWYDPTGQQSYAYDDHATAYQSQAYQPATTNAHQNGSYASYGQHDQYAQSSVYSQPAASTKSAYEPAYVQQQSYAPKTYAAYPQSTSTYAPATTAQQAPLTQNGTYAPSTYDPYKPTQTQSSLEPGFNAVNSSVSASSSYDPYKPAYTAAPPAHTHTYGTDSHTSAYGTSQVAVPPPPAPLASAAVPPSPVVSVTQYRPKTSNAYDPPIPPPKVKHVAPPRVVYNTPPPVSPVSPPPRTTLSPQVPLAPPPKGPRTPDPHVKPPHRNDSHSSTTYAPPQRAQSSPYAPPAVNGSASAYQPSYNPPMHHAGAPASGGMRGGPPRLAAEGLPKVNDTYAPPHHNYIPALPQQSSLPEAPAAPAYEPSHLDHASPVSDVSAERTTSALHDIIPEVDEDIAAVFGSAEEAIPRTASSSPPTSAAVAFDSSAWSTQGAYPPPMQSSPDKTITPLPPRASSTAPPSHSQASPTTYDPYAPMKSDTSDRAKSPSATSVRSLASPPKSAYDPPLRRDSVATSLSRPLSSQSRRSTLSNSYDPQSVTDLKRAASPASSIRSMTASKSAYDPYAPSDKTTAVSAASIHARTTSNGSTYSTSSSADPYAPARLPARTSSEHAYGSFAIPATTYAPPSNAYVPSVPPVPTYDRTGAQVVTLAAPVHSTYAPSPSLLGTNDPLGRAAARVPVISFGFGGKVVTCFHGANMNTSFDVALSARQSTDINIRMLHSIIPESVLDSSATSYPGPLYCDPGSPTASLVRTGAQALKAKKAKVIKYLEDKAEEMAAGLGYHRVGTVDRSRAEAKRILVSLLKVMVENDGHLSGSAQIDAAVRAALVPKEGVSSADFSTGGSAMIPATSAELLSSNYPLSSAIPTAQEQIVSKTVVRSSQLTKIQELLAQGDRRGACHYAADEKLWQHALLIASSVDKECWKEVVTEWIRAELVTDDSQAQGDVTNGRESLRVAYSLFGGNGASAVQELVHPKSLLQHGHNNNLQIPQPQLTVTPMTPSFPVVQPLNISQEVLASWATTAAMILSNPITPESSSALSALGDQLAVHQWTEAAHACYLLSPQTSPLGGIGSIPKLILLGSPPPNSSPIYYKDPDPLIYSEIFEFAMSLATPAKGQEPFAGLHHLQPYRLIRAANLAEIGHVQLATRYCEAITTCVTRTSPYLNITLGEQLKGLTDRLVAAPQLDKSGSWIGGKMAKPSLDSIGNWLEGRFTKFIAGEGDSPRPEESKGMEHQQSYSGPFANFSSISSATNSTYPSPHQSVTDLTDVSTAAPPFRSGSALGNRPPSRQINRATSAMDHVRPFQRTGSPIARVASASAATFADAASYGQARADGPYGNGYAPAQGLNHLNSHGDVSGQHSKPPSTGSWGWGVSESEAATPTASTFVSLDDQPSSGTSNSGFISLMDDAASTPTASKLMNYTPRASQQAFDEDDEEDLGFGNKGLKSKTDTPANGDASSEAAVKDAEKPKSQAADADRPELKQTASGGWLSRIWGRSQSNTPAPVKANLGEQSSFYYDKELKRWVNKTAGAEAAKPSPAPPPPPSRAQTASPGRQFGGLQPPPSPHAPPPRPATAQPMDMTSEPPRRPPPTRIRSNLVPSDAEGISAPPSPLPSSATPPPGSGPPAGRARGGAAKRNVRSRYVDVFSQENGGAS